MVLERVSVIRVVLGVLDVVQGATEPQGGRSGREDRPPRMNQASIRISGTLDLDTEPACPASSGGGGGYTPRLSEGVGGDNCGETTHTPFVADRQPVAVESPDMV